MPRPNQPRSIVSEQALARRIAHERESRGMSYEGLASRMTRAGCPIQASAIYKIEKSDPPRRIVVAELVAFSQVFSVPVEQLLLPPELVAADEIAELVMAWSRAQDRTISAQQEETEAWERVSAWVEQHPEYHDKMSPIIRHWSELYFEDGHDFRVARMMWDLTSESDWGERAKTAFDALVAQGRRS